MPKAKARGCDNRESTGGASIRAIGLNQLSEPSLFFTTADENASVASILIQGSLLTNGVAFGHGVRCADGTLVRMYAKVAAGGSIAVPELPTDLDIPARSAAAGDTIHAGEKRWYQVYYRDSTIFLPGCLVPANQFNATNAAEVVWLP